MPDNSTGKSFKPTKYIPVSTAAILLVGSSTLFFVFTCPWLTRAVSPLIPFYNGIVFLFVLANFSMATFMDPGIFPRADEDEDKEDDFRAPLYKNVEIKGIQVRMKWCATCHFYRPPRCSHCSVCDNCVEDFDHHCPWVNNCIGRRNYRYFFLFLLSLSVHMVGVFAFGLIYILNHLERLGALHTTVTLVVMCVAGLFFIPVVGLTGFHMVLVARGRTTNEQVTGKFRGGVNPFTRGCCGNIEYVLCSPLAPRYVVEPKRLHPVNVKPPFLRPDLPTRQISVKVNDNGIHANIPRTKSKVNLDSLEDKCLDSQPPLPPKADLNRYTELKSQLTSSEESTLSTKPLHPSTPAMYKYRPTFGMNPKVLYQNPGEKVILQESCQSSPILEENGRGHDYRSEPNLDFPESKGSSIHRAFTSSPLQLDSFAINSRSLSLKHAHRRGGDKTPVHTIRSEGNASSPYKSVFAPTSLSNRNGSLSYDSLLNPSISPSSGECLAHPGVPMVGYHSPYLTAKMCHIQGGEIQHQAPSSYSPILSSRHSPHPRDPSPVRYDNLSKTIMASIQERKEMEEKEKLLHSHPHKRGLAADMYATNSGVYEASGSYGLKQGAIFPDEPRIPPKLSYGSRDNLLGGPSVFNTRNLHSRTPVNSLASSAGLGRAPRTSTTSLHTDVTNNNVQSHQALQSRPGEGAFRSPVHQAPSSPLVLPRSPSYNIQTPLSFMNALDMTDSPPPLGGPREEVQLKAGHSKLNGQPGGLPRAECRLGSTSSSQGNPVSPNRNANVKKVSGVGGTTYEISV
ncbi:palmitoyltransferase ZDHHC8B [Erpetoichthys calabaricus]|uniref:Palmitoyltransferase n=1 Tax=Erpetoichthys calabaricus TaxID=27687 RepID=A0A8C4TI59_ERPCA|nr:palmitoyltransferase ZDHHC8B [Erpetoichthys calabaricus]